MVTNIRFLIFTFLFLSAASFHASAQIFPGAMWNRPNGVVVQTASTFASLGVHSLSYSANVKAGNILVACISANSDVDSITDTQSNTWVSAVRQGGTYGFDVECWQAQKIAGGATQVTVTTGGTHMIITLMEVSGMVSLDRVSSASGTGATATLSSLGAVEETNSFVVAYASAWANAPTWSVDNGFAVQQLSQPDSGGHYAVLATKNARSAGVQTINFGKDFVADGWHGAMLVFKATENVPRLIQHASNSTTGTTLAITLPQAVKGNSALLACVSTESSGFSISDNLNGTYSGDMGTIGGLGCKIIFNVKAGSATITLTIDDPVYATMSVFEISGNLSEVVERDSDYGNSGTSVTLSTSNLSNGNYYVLAFAGPYWVTTQTHSNWTVSSGFATQELAGLSGGKYKTIAVDRNIKKALSGVQSVTLTIDTPISHWYGIIMVLK